MPPRGPRARAVALLALALAACGAPPTPATPWTEARLARMELRARVAQLVAPVVRADRPLTDSANIRLRAAARAGLGGLYLAGGAAAPLAARVDSLRAGAPLPPLVVARLDRGAGSRFAGATELPSPVALAAASTEDEVRSAARLAAAEARALGVGLALLPGPALPAASPALTPATDSPGTDERLAAFMDELEEEGVLAGVTAFAPPSPSSDAAVPVLRWDRAALEAAQLGTLASLGGRPAAVEAGLVALPALTGDSAPLPFSPVVTFGVLRRDLGFGGMVVADLTRESPLGRRYHPGPAAVAAVASGADLLLVDEAGPAIDSLVAAVESGRLSRARVDAAARNVFAAKRRARLGLPPVTAEDSARARRAPPAAREAAAGAADAFARTMVVAGAEPARALAGCRAIVVVASPRADTRPLLAALRARLPGALPLSADSLARRGPLSADSAVRRADCVVAAAFPGAPLPVVERAAPADTARPDSAARRVVYLLFTEAAGAVPGGVGTVVLARGTGAEAQRTAAARLFAAPPAPGDDAPRPPAPAWPAARVLARAPAQDAAMSADSLARVDRILNQALDDGVFTGAVVAIGRHGRLVRLTGYGRTGGRPMEGSLAEFDIASLTKVVGTTAAVMALVEDGKIGLDAPVRRYVPQFRGSGKGDVTIRHLLTHTSGLPAGDWLYGSAGDPGRALRQVLRVDLDAEPGKRVLYSDFGMILLAEVVRRRAGEPVDRFLARRVWTPLGMESTMYLPPWTLQDWAVPSALKSERAYVLDGVVHDGNAFRLGGVAGHAGLFSTARDLSVYAQTLLNGGAYGTRRVWRTATVQAFTTKQPGAGTRALGWDTPARASSSGGYFSSRSYGHTGFTGTSIWIDPARDIFVVLLTNRTYDAGSQTQILNVRRAVHDAAVRAITDINVTARIGTPEYEREQAAKRRPKPRPRRPTRPRRRG